MVVLVTRGGVEDTRLEAKAKDTKKIRGQGQGQPFRGQNLSRPRTGMLEAKAKDQGHRRKCSQKKKVFKIFFQAISNSLAYPEFLIGVSPALNCRGDASPHRDLASSQRDLSAGLSDEKGLILYQSLAKNRFNFRRRPFFFGLYLFLAKKHFNFRRRPLFFGVCSISATKLRNLS